MPAMDATLGFTLDSRGPALHFGSFRAGLALSAGDPAS